MTVLAPRFHPRSRHAGRPPGDVGALTRWMVFAGAALWSVLALASALNLVAALGSGRRPLVIVFGVPLVVAAALVLRRRPVAPPLRLAVGWSVLLASSLGVGVALPSQPLVAAAIPALVLSAVVCVRYPAIAVTACLALSACFGSIRAFTGLHVGIVVDLLLAGLWLGVAFGLVFKPRERPHLAWLGIVAIASYVALTAFEILTSTSLTQGVQSFRGSVWYLGAALLIAYADWSPQVRARLARGVVVVAALVGAYATLRWIIGPAAVERTHAQDLTQGYLLVDQKIRVFGSFSSGHQLGAWTATLIPYCLACALTFSRWWRVLAATAAVLCTLAMFASEVRASVVGVTVGVILVLALYQAARGVPGLHLGVTLGAVVAVLAVAGVIFSSTISTSNGSAQRYTILLTPTQDPSYVARVDKWRAAFGDIDRHPLGSGLGSGHGSTGNIYEQTSLLGYGVDNSFLVIAVEQGFVVMVFFLGSLLMLLGGLARRAVRTSSRHRAGVGIGACGSLVSFAIVMFTGDYFYDPIALAAWIVVGLGLSHFTSPEASSAPDGRHAASAPSPVRV